MIVATDFSSNLGSCFPLIIRRVSRILWLLLAKTVPNFSDRSEQAFIQNIIERLRRHQHE